MVTTKHCENFLKDVSCIIEYHDEIKKLLNSYVVPVNTKEKPAKLLNIIAKVEVRDDGYYLNMRILSRLETGDMAFNVRFSLSNIEKYMEEPTRVIEEIVRSFHSNFRVIPQNELTALLYSPE